jgi:hypothetical protein
MEYTEEEYYKFLEDFDASGEYQDLPDVDDYSLVEYFENNVEF